MHTRIRPALIFASIFLSAALTAYSQGPSQTPRSEYKGITLGLTADAVRAKLGEPKEKSDAQDLYIFSSSEAAQFFYDGAKNVNAMMINYTGDLKDAPTAKDIFGVDVPPREDGMIFKMERYPKLGYWISYTRMSGADAMVTIAIQKL